MSIGKSDIRLMLSMKVKESFLCESLYFFSLLIDFQTVSLAEYDGVISVGGDGMFAEVTFDKL